ncbi:MAG: DR2241 family protein, partial [Terrimicrobiaceae bacterium]
MPDPVTKILRTDSLPHLLEDALAAGFTRIGQVEILPHAAGFSLCHIEDAGRSDLQAFKSSEDATLIARCRDTGEYRPLKSAPDLRHGWRLDLSSLEELILALDALYPAALGNWR